MCATIAGLVFAPGLTSAVQYNPATVPQYNPVVQASTVCKYTQCSSSNPCAQGVCNNGYCCGPSISENPGAPIMSEFFYDFYG